MHRLPPALPRPFTALLAVSLLAGAVASQKGVYTDSMLGIKIKAPARWSYLGKVGDRGALRALYSSPRFYKPRQGRSRHTPTMRVLWFPKPKDDAKKPDEKSVWPLLTPYTSIKDYLARVYVGLEQVSVELGPIGKMKGRRYIFAGKGNGGEDLTLHVAMVELEDGEFAIEFECLTDHHKKLKASFEKSLISLSPTTRNEAQAETPPLWESDRESWLKLDAGKRRKERETWGKKWLAARKSATEAGWKTSKTKNFLIISHADTKFTKRATKAAEVIRTWVDGWIGETSDEAVMPAVIRIYADKRELTAYQSRNLIVKKYEPQDREVLFFKDAALGNSGAGFYELILGIFNQVLHDKHPLVEPNMPRWMGTGLEGYMYGSKIKGKKLSFFPSEAEVARFTYHKQHDNKKLPWLWDFMKEMIGKGPKDGAAEIAWNYGPECSRLLRWLDESGSPVFGKTKFLPNYLRQVGDLAAKAPPDLGAQVDQRLLDDGRRAELNRLIYQRRDALIDKIADAVITVTDTWHKGDKAFKTYVTEFKR